MKCEQTLFSLILVVSPVIQVSSNVVESLYTKGLEYSNCIFPNHVDVASGDTLRFSVRTARDAHILLASFEASVFEISLGARNNTINIIKDSRDSDGNEEKAVVRTVNLLSWREFRNFWVKIKDEYNQKKSNVLQVGIGTEDTPFLEWRYHYRTFPWAVCFRSDGWAEWRYGYIDDTYTDTFYSVEEEIIVSKTRNYLGNGQYFPLSEIASHSNDAVTLYFSLRSKDEIRILLSPEVARASHVLEFSVENDSVSISQYQGGALLRKPAYVKNALGIDGAIVQYWIKLSKDGQIGMGQGNSSRPVLHIRNSHLRSPQFVSFSSLSEYDQEFNISIDATYIWPGLGPTYTTISKSQDCSPRWKEAKNRQLPPGAVRGGYNDRDELFVCRAKHYRHVLPGSFVPDNEEMGTCRVAFNIDVIRKTSFEVLTGCQFAWIPASLGHIPEEAIPAGKDSTGEIVYVIRATHEGQVIIGKLHSGHRIAYIAFDNLEVLPFTNYEVLVKGEYATA